jgi:ankyrin repeat protein
MGLGNCMQVVEALLTKCHIDANCKDQLGRTALMHAVDVGDSNILSLLRQHGASLTACDIQDCNAMHYASQSGRLHIVSMLMDWPAEEVSKAMSTSNSMGHTPLAISINNSYKEVAQLLIERGADVASEVGATYPTLLL